MTNYRKIVLTAFATAFLLLLGYGLSVWLGSRTEEAQQKPIETPKKFVNVVPVSYSTIPTEIVAYGRVASAQPLRLTTEVAGKIQAGSVPLKSGQHFKAGQLLFSIDDTEAKWQLNADRSAFLKNIAIILPDFKIDFPQNYPAWEAYFKSIQADKTLPELPTYTSEKEKTYLAVKDIFTTYYRIKSTEARLAKYKITAPYSGTFTNVYAEIGSVVSINGAVADIISTEKHELRLPIAYENIKWISIGKKVKIQAENTTLSWQGYIVRISETINQTTQSVDVFVNVIANQYPIYEGAYLTATIDGIFIKDAMEIPRKALFDGKNICVITQDTLLEVKPVNILKITNEKVCINGLEAQTLLITDPPAGAYNGMKVFRRK